MRHSAGPLLLFKVNQTLTDSQEETIINVPHPVLYVKASVWNK